MTTQVLLMIGIVIVVNIISDQLYFRLDLTADRRNSGSLVGLLE